MVGLCHSAALAMESEVTCANTQCAYSQSWAGWGTMPTVQKGCSFERLLPFTTAPRFNPCTQSVHSAAQLCTYPVLELTPEPKHLHSLLSSIRIIHAMRGCRGWKHLGEDGASPWSLENEEGDVEQMLKRLGIQQSLWKGQARGACLHTRVCNIFVASPEAALREPDLFDTCHPGRKLPS